MYWPVTSIKLGSVLSLVTIVLFQGCATDRSTIPTSQSGTNYYYEPENVTYYTVQRGDTLSLIARQYGLNYQEIAALNDIYPPYLITPGQSLKIPGTGGGDISTPSRFQVKPSSPPQRYTTTTATKRPTQRTSSGRYHTVQRGETLYGIAKRYGKDYRQVAAWNNIPSPYILNVGQRLHLTASQGVTSSKYSRSTSSVPATSDNITPSSQAFSGRTAPSSQPSTSGTVSHIVQRGDTIYGIAQRYGYNVADIAQWNGLRPPYNLSVGRRLRVAPLPTRQGSLSTQSHSSLSTYHTVISGETLYSISKKYGREVADIAVWNNLQPPYTLSQGQRLQVAPLNTSPSSQKKYSTQTAVQHNSGYHTVARGETLYSISRKYGYTTAELSSWNHLRSPSDLSVGQSLRVYPPSGVTLGRHEYLAAQKTTGQSGSYHTVARGETLYSIAKRYGYSVTEVARWNSLHPPYNLSVGQRLQISPITSTAWRGTTTQRRSGTRHHIVRPGETLTSIATKYGVSAYELSDWNGIGSPYTLYPGQKLLVLPP